MSIVGSLCGAKVGAIIGTAILGPVGTVVGAKVGALIGSGGNPLSLVGLCDVGLDGVNADGIDPPVDGHGNPIDTQIHGGRPTDIHGNPPHDLWGNPR